MTVAPVVQEVYRGAIDPTQRRSVRYDVYLANALFSEAERAFNTRLADQLRASGLSVFVPQQTAENVSRHVSPETIFSSDYLAICQSSIILAILDGDVVDTGVSCEIGLGRAAGIPIVGLWTDTRQHRASAGRPLLNIFLQGAIEQNGVVCATIEEATNECRRIKAFLEPDQRATAVLDHYRHSRDALARVLTWIPAAYRPPLDIGAEIIRELDARRPSLSHIVDIGAGTGWLGDVVRLHWPEISYEAFDPADDRLPEIPIEGNADAAVLSFVLHDVPDQQQLLKRVACLLVDGGIVTLLDLTPEDLPKLQSVVAQQLALSGKYETRITAGRLAPLAEGAGLEISSVRFLLREFVLSSRHEFDDYVTAFALDKGFDFPWLPLADHRETLARVAGEMSFPFIDRRVFIACQLTKRSTSPS